MRKWEQLPPLMQCEEVKPIYDILRKRKLSRLMKRMFDFVFALLLLVIALPFMIIIAIMIKIDSRGPIFYRQERITKNLQKFRIFKFRTMIQNADRIGSLVTVDKDPRITRIGRFMRKLRIDEVPQVINVLIGQMTFVGTRPEVEKYVKRYDNKMLSTLLMPAGITSPASIKFRDEEKLLQGVTNVDDAYVRDVLPIKMQYNYEYLAKFRFFRDLGIMIKTVFAVLK